MNYRGARCKTGDVKSRKTPAFGRKHARDASPDVSCLDATSSRGVMAFPLCASTRECMWRENGEKREGETDGQGVTERERERRFERMQKSGMEEPGKRGRDGKGEKECGAVTTSK